MIGGRTATYVTQKLISGHRPAGIPVHRCRFAALSSTKAPIRGTTTEPIGFVYAEDFIDEATEEAPWPI